MSGNVMPHSDVQRELGMTEGFDIALEMSGSAEALNAGVQNMAHGGRIAEMWMFLGAAPDAAAAFFA